MKFRLIIAAIFLLPILARSQAFRIDKPPLPIDSLRKILPLLHDSGRVDCLIELARSYAEVMIPSFSDSAQFLAAQAYKEAASIKYLKGLGDASLRFGLFAQWYTWDVREMKKYFGEAISWYKKNTK